MNFLEEKTGGFLDGLTDFIAAFRSNSRHLDNKAILAKRLHEIVAQAAVGEAFGQGGLGLLDGAFIDWKGVSVLVLSGLDFDDEGGTTDEIDSAFKLLLHGKDGHQAKDDHDADGDGADVALAAVDFGRDIPEDEGDDGDTGTDDDERVVLEVHELLTLESENLLFALLVENFYDAADFLFVLKSLDNKSLTQYTVDCWGNDALAFKNNCDAVSSKRHSFGGDAQTFPAFLVQTNVKGAKAMAGAGLFNVGPGYDRFTGQGNGFLIGDFASFRVGDPDFVNLIPSR